MIISPYKRMSTLEQLHDDNIYQIFKQLSDEDLYNVSDTADDRVWWIANDIARRRIQKVIGKHLRDDRNIDYLQFINMEYDRKNFKNIIKNNKYGAAYIIYKDMSDYILNDHIYSVHNNKLIKEIINKYPERIDYFIYKFVNNGDYKSMLKLLKMIPKKRRKYYGKMMLSSSARRGQLDMVVHLINLGYDTDILNDTVSSGNLDLVKYVTRRNGSDCSGVVDNGYDAVFESLYTDNYNIFRYFMEECLPRLNINYIEDIDNNKILELIVKTGNVELMKYVTDLGFVFDFNNFDSVLLFMHNINNKYEIAALLLENSINKGQISQDNPDLLEALEGVYYNQKYDLLDLYQREFNIDDSIMMFAWLLYVISEGDVEKVNDYIANGLDVTMFNNKALNKAVEDERDYDIIELLIGAGADVDVIDISHVYDEVIVEYLIDMGYDVHKNNDEAIYRAAEGGYYNMAKMLLRKGANPTSRLREIRRALRDDRYSEDRMADLFYDYGLRL